jgi:hypothetical protein
MTGAEFMDALRAAIAPLVVAKVESPGAELRITLSDGRVIKPRRSRIKSSDEAGMQAYITELVGG